LRLSALIHDVGKLAVPAEILAKPGRLTDIEFKLIMQHSQAGYDILAGIEFNWPVPRWCYSTMSAVTAPAIPAP